MAYHAKSQKTYNDKCNRIGIKYTPKEINEYNRLVEYCDNNNLSYQGYIKQLVKADLDNKGIPYPNDIE